MAAQEDKDIEFATDIYIGAKAISRLIAGVPMKLRKIYHLAEKSNMPFFKIGSLLAMRRSVYIKYIEDQEQKARERGILHCPHCGAKLA